MAYNVAATSACISEFFLLLQLLFTDTQVGSLATGLEVAAVVGKVVGGVLSAGTAEMSVRIQVHSAQQTLGVGKLRRLEKQVRARARARAYLNWNHCLRP